MTKGLLLPVIAIIAIGLAAPGSFYLSPLSWTTIGGQDLEWTGTWLAQAATSKVGDFLPYDCGAPAVLTTLVCDKLPPGYVILPRLPNSPAPTRPSNMSDSAWLLLQKTFANGVCDPNETWITDPFDCAAPGSTIQDPYTGRPGVPAAVCQPVLEHLPGQSAG